MKPSQMISHVNSEQKSNVSKALTETLDFRSEMTLIA
jgi:hypothetical protein